MKPQNLRLTALTVLFSFTLAACDKPIASESAGGGMGEATAIISDGMNLAAEKFGALSAQSGGAFEDAAITAKIKAAISTKVGFMLVDIHVDTVDQVVLLTGTVDSRARSDTATQIARDISGVKLVENRLIVKPPLWG